MIPNLSSTRDTLSSLSAWDHGIVLAASMFSAISIMVGWALLTISEQPGLCGNATHSGTNDLELRYGTRAGIPGLDQPALVCGMG